MQGLGDRLVCFELESLCKAGFCLPWQELLFQVVFVVICHVFCLEVRVAMLGELFFNE
jgi:hypothetical protein